MVKARARKPLRRDGGRANKDAVNGAESVLPPKKPPAPSAKHRLKRGRRAKLMK
jgi:hypothetical protein